MRNFYNVGNALFSKESIGDKNFVYDCGGQHIDELEKVIRKAFKNKDKIEAVFISHYDRDHINGLHFLLNYCEVKLLVLPLISETEKLILLGFLNYTEEEVDFVLDPVGYIQRISQGQTRVVFVRDIEVDELDYEGHPGISFDELQVNGKTILSTKRLIISSALDWVFIPMWMKLLTIEEEEKFTVELCGLLELSEKEFKRMNIKDLWKKYNLCGSEKKVVSTIQNKIKKALKTAIPEMTDAKINENSLTLYSGPANKTCPCNSIGTLYLGDFDAKTESNWNKLEKVYGRFRNNTGVVQIPHHGSENNFNEKLINKGTLAVISLGTDDTIATGSVFTDILSKGGLPLITAYKGDICVPHIIGCMNYPFFCSIDLCIKCKKAFSLYKHL